MIVEWKERWPYDVWTLRWRTRCQYQYFSIIGGSEHSSAPGCENPRISTTNTTAFFRSHLYHHFKNSSVHSLVVDMAIFTSAEFDDFPSYKKSFGTRGFHGHGHEDGKEVRGKAQCVCLAMGENQDIQRRFDRLVSGLELFCFFFEHL